LAPVVTFKTFDEVVERANSLEYGLAAYAFTSSNATAAAIGDALESGMVGVNSIAISTPETPFGGVKESGHGSEGGIEGVGAYLLTKFISQGERCSLRAFARPHAEERRSATAKGVAMHARMRCDAARSMRPPPSFAARGRQKRRV